MLDDIAAFLGIGPWHQYPSQRTNPTPRDQAGPPPTADDMRRLTDVYADDLALFASLVGRRRQRVADHADRRRHPRPRRPRAELARKVGLLPEE